jgi:6-phosphogluconolactonase
MRLQARLFVASLIGLLAAPAVLAPAQVVPDSALPGSYRVYFGTYTDGGKSEGIYACELNAAVGTFTEPRLVAKTVNPSFLAIHPTKKYLYAVSEISEVEGERTGAVAAFAIDAPTGDLKLLNKQSSHGAGPCHLVVDPTGSAVLVANYGGGSVASLPIQDDGSLGPAASTIQHTGQSVNPQRQEAPHAHSINLDPAGRFALAADLGLDQVLVYTFDAETAQLAAHDPPFAAVSRGAGPRHLAFHPTGQYAYVINELANTVTAFAFDADLGTLTTIQTISTLPSDFGDASYTAEVQVHPSGKFLYGSNRGHDSLAIFTIDEFSGKLTEVGHQKTGGQTPRNFGIDPTGGYVLAANQASDTVVPFQVDQETGELKQIADPLAVPAPVCVKFVPLEE